jgi:hypothetical protein
MDRDDLYGLPVEQFTAQRNALVKQLRRDGERDRAAEVSKLRKPSVAAWAVNQLVRTQRREVDALFSAGDALQQAQAELLAGRGNPASLRQAVDSERAAVDRLVERARGLLSSDGHDLTPARLEQVSETLQAAALDQDSRARIRSGCLDRELRHIGLGAPGTPSAPRRRTRSAPGGKRPAGQARSARDTEKGRRQVARLAAARRTEADARRQLARAVRAVDAAEERRDRAQARLDETGGQLAAARELAAGAAREHEQARAALERLSG